MKHFQCDGCGKPVPKTVEWSDTAWLIERNHDGHRLAQWFPQSKVFSANPENCFHLCSFACAEKMILAFLAEEKARMAKHAKERPTSQ